MGEGEIIIGGISFGWLGDEVHFYEYLQTKESYKSLNKSLSNSSHDFGKRESALGLQNASDFLREFLRAGAFGWAGQAVEGCDRI